MSPAGSRTATAQWSCPRIITPSTTAWPPERCVAGGGGDAEASPTGSALGGLLRCLGLRVSTLEALDPSAGVHELLLARVEGMPIRAELGADLAHGGPGREGVPA